MASNKLLVLDVDGVVSPVHPREGHLAWGDEVEAGNVFGPVLVSPTLCVRLNQLAELPDVDCVWLTSWTPDMRSQMEPFPGRAWPDIGERCRHGAPEDGAPGTGWWKWHAFHAWINDHPEVDRLTWCDDDLVNTPTDDGISQLDHRGFSLGHVRPNGYSDRARAHTWRRPNRRRIFYQLIAPETAVGLTRSDLERIERFLVAR